MPPGKYVKLLPGTSKAMPAFSLETTGVSEMFSAERQEYLKPTK